MANKKLTLDEEILAEIKKKHLTPEEAKRVLAGFREHKPVETRTYKIGKEKIRYLAISDSHIGNVNYDPDLMTHAAKTAKEMKVDFAIHGGDVVDGWYQNRPQQVFELNAIGGDQQIDMAVKELSKLGDIPFRFITANHEWNTYMRGAGIEVGGMLEDKLTKKGMDVTFLGNDQGNIELANGTRIMILHPDGGSSYAVSYKSQKIAESLEGGKKPHILHIGHFHKAEYIFWRNIHIVQMGTLEGQTKFMRGKHLSAMKGFYIIDVTTNKKGEVDVFTPRFYPSYK